MSILGVLPAAPDDKDFAYVIAGALSLAVLDESTALMEGVADGFLLVADQQLGLSLHFLGGIAPGPICVDFVGGANAHRRHFGGGKSQMIAKAVGIKGWVRPHIVDVTAGLGQDGFALAALGCSVTLVERVPVVFHLLKDGLRRAERADDAALQVMMSAISLVQADAISYLQQQSELIDVVYLDPMFPERHKSAQVKKSMQAFQSIVGGDLDAGDLLACALQKARYRVVIKRPRKAPGIHEQFPEKQLPAPGLLLTGKSCRYDIYPLRKML